MFTVKTTFEDRKAIYNEAVDKYGVDNQTWVLVEEVGELLQALGKTMRSRTENKILRDDNHLAEETADVFIALEQLCENFGLSALLDFMVDFKLRRLKSRMESENGC